MNKIKKMIKSILYCLNEAIHYKILKKTENNNSNNLNEIIDKDAELEKITTIELNQVKDEYKWVGAVNYENNMYCITNRSEEVLKLNLENNKIEYLECKCEDEKGYRWTGGGKYNGKIFGFPRTSNKLLCIDPQKDKVSTIDLNLDYKKEHHYAGVLTKKGYIYQPPRNNNSILVINLNDFSTHEIKIAPKLIKYRYLTGIQHTNGLIYFFPEKNEKVLVLNPESEEFYFIGNRMNCMVFDAAVGADDNIYGFSGYEKGILKIDTKNHKCEMICKEIGIPGCYGSKLAINGKIYGIPGNGKFFWEFDIEKQEAKKVFEVEEDMQAKCAGGIMTKDGDIYTVPAFGNKIYKLEFTNKKCLSDEYLDSIYFSDNY